MCFRDFDIYGVEFEKCLHSKIGPMAAMQPSLLVESEDNIVACVR